MLTVALVQRISNPLVFGTRVCDPHDALPAETVIVSPEEAFEMQVLKLAWSIVEVQRGLEPVQAAPTDGHQASSNNKNNLNFVPRRLILRTLPTSTLESVSFWHGLMILAGSPV
jgi:hypothetical protein